MTGRISTRFVRREDGAGTVFSLLLFVILAMLLGLMVDATNAWRNRTFLTSVADIAAHAGVVALATGKTDAEVAEEAVRIVEANLRSGSFGGVMDAESDVFVMHYDPAARTFASNGPKNAVVVRVGRTEGRGNPVGTYLLRFAGIDLWNVTAESAAVFNETCGATDGIFAKGQITLTSQNDIGSGFCIHSEEKVWLPQQNTFAADSYVSMPDLAECGNKCNSDANPGLVEGVNAIENHKIFPDFAETTRATYAAFRAPAVEGGEKQAHFEGVSVANSINTLKSAGINVSSNASPGDLVSLTHAQFHALPQLPQGFVYDVQCPTSGGGGKSKLTFNATTAKMSKAALTTNCAIEFGDGASIVGSVVITIRDSSNAVVTASSGALVADTTGTCQAANRSTIMSVSDVSVPAKFVMSNVTIISGGDISIASASSGATQSTGVALYASGDVHIASQHTFRSCGGGDAGLIPDLDTLRLVMPPQIGEQLAGLN